jgi:anthranilate phosphoribosyltransferase
MSLRSLIRILGPGRKDSRNLTYEEAHRAFDAILSGSESDIEVATFLVLVRMKGLTVEELMGFARAARARAKIPCDDMPGLVSVCPPHDGFDSTPPLEVAAGLVAAAVGVRVLVLTDRCVPPKRGLTAASVLEGLGLQTTFDPDEAESWVAKTRFGVCSVAGMLPALMSLRRVRDEVVIRTPLATVEKLLAPANSAVLLGAQGGPVLGTAVEVIHELGHPRGIAIQGPEGGVVPSVKKRTRGIELAERHLVPLNIEPEDFGLLADDEPDMPQFGPPPDGTGTGDNPELIRFVADTTRAVLAGQPGPARNATLLTAGLILKAGGRALTLAEGIDHAAHAVDSGAANGVLERLAELSS